MTELPTELPVYLIALQKQGMMLPQQTVAEIIPYEPLQRVEETPDWFLGLLGWRGEQVPVVSFEMLTLERASFSLVSVSSASLVVIKGLNNQEDLPLYAMVSQTPPRLLDVTSEMLFETGEVAATTEIARVQFENEMVSIPDLHYIETSICDVIVAP